MTYNDIITFSLLIITMLLWGITPLLEKIGLRDVEPLTGILIRSFAITVVLLIIYIFTGKLNELTKVSAKSFFLFSMSGILAGLLGMWTYFYVLKAGFTSKIVPIAAAYPLITAILGRSADHRLRGLQRDAEDRDGIVLDGCAAGLGGGALDAGAEHDGLGKRGRGRFDGAADAAVLDQRPAGFVDDHDAAAAGVHRLHRRLDHDPQQRGDVVG